MAKPKEVDVFDEIIRLKRERAELLQVLKQITEVSDPGSLAHRWASNTIYNYEQST